MYVNKVWELDNLTLKLDLKGKLNSKSEIIIPTCIRTQFEGETNMKNKILPFVESYLKGKPHYKFFNYKIIQLETYFEG